MQRYSDSTVRVRMIDPEQLHKVRESSEQQVRSHKKAMRRV